MLLATPKQIHLGLLLLRIAIGCFMMVHGAQKAANFSALSETFADPIGLGSQLSLILAIAAEVGCSVLVILGVFTRLAVIPLAFTMAVALFVVHAEDPWKVKELSAVFLGTYIALVFTGPGEYSFDQWLANRKARSVSR